MIKLLDLIKIDDPKKYKLHLACRESGLWINPLDEYVADHNKWGSCSLYHSNSLSHCSFEISTFILSST